MLKRNITLLCAIGLLQGMVFYGPIATLYRQAAGLSVFQIAGIESVSLILMMVLELPWGYVADRIGYRRTMLCCTGLYFVSKLVFWQARGFGGFLAERVLLSVVCSGLSGVDSAMLYQSCGREDARRIFGIYDALQQTGLLLAAGIFALCLGERYRLAAALTAVSYGVAVLLAFGLREVRVQTPERQALRQSLQVLRQQLCRPRTVLLILAVALFNETHQMITVFLNQLQYARCGMSPGMISLVYCLMSLAGLSGVFSARLSHRWQDRRVGSGLMGTGAVCCGILCVTSAPVLSVLAVLGLRVAFSLLQPIQLARQNEQIKTDHRATALSMNAALLSGVGVGTNLVFGAAADRSLSLAMALGAVLCLMGLLLWQFSCSKK